MTPQDQEFLLTPEIGQRGDCARAVIASLLDLPIAEVPHFSQEVEGSENNFYQRVKEFLAARGFGILWLCNPELHLPYDADTYHLISGPSPRGNGIYHNVVGCNGKIFHDPHPDRSGLAGDPEEWQHSFLFRLKP